jgi:hypothetical protein
MARRKFKQTISFKCDRCKRKVKEKEARRNRYGAKNNQPHTGTVEKMRLCRECITVVNREYEMLYNPPDKDLMVRDFVGNDATKLAEEFILRQLGQYDFSGSTVYVTLRHIDNHLGSVIVKPLIPARPRGKESRKSWRPWYEVGIQVRKTLEYPHTETRNVASVAVTDPVAKAFMKEKWFYETAEVTFRDEAEAFVFAAGNGLFKVLRKHLPKEVPGRASKVGMNVHGIKWLEEFRKWRSAPGTSPEVMAYAV